MKYRIFQPISFSTVIGVGMAVFTFVLQTTFEKCTVKTIGDSTMADKLVSFEHS
ncbi:MAG: hypothetical protein AB9846_03535 [Tenuifilaceae bacterium]